MNTRKSRRKLKRQHNQIAKNCKFDMLVFDCNYHVAKIVKSGIYPGRDIFDSGIQTISLLDGRGCSCSIMNCCPAPVPKDKVNELLATYKEHGFLAYLRKLGWSDEAISGFQNLNDEWKFQEITIL